MVVWARKKETDTSTQGNKGTHGDTEGLSLERSCKARDYEEFDTEGSKLTGVPGEGKRPKVRLHVEPLVRPGGKTEKDGSNKALTEKRE